MELPLAVSQVLKDVRMFGDSAFEESEGPGEVGGFGGRGSHLAAPEWVIKL
jgi:hypothetical protein